MVTDGATEASGVTSNSGPELALHPSSTGSPLPNTQLKITNSDGSKELAVGEIGEIWINGPGVAIGYYGNEKATREAFVNGWYKVGGSVRFVCGRGMVLTGGFVR